MRTALDIETPAVLNRPPRALSSADIANLRRIIANAEALESFPRVPRHELEIARRAGRAAAALLRDADRLSGGR